MDSTFLDQIIEKHGPQRDSLIPILQEIQGRYRYLPRSSLQYLCRNTEISAADVLGVSTFYNQFRFEPIGEHLINVCTGTACHVKGASQILEGFRNHLGITGEEDTDQKRKFTVQKVACLGCCTLAPVVQIDRISYGHLTVNQVGDVIDDFLGKAGTTEEQTALSMKTGSEIGEVRIGLGSCCQAQGSRAVCEQLQRVIRSRGQKIHIKPVGCVGMCFQTPLLETVSKNGVSTFYAKVRPEDVESILFRDFAPPSWRKKAWFRLENWMSRLWSDEFPDPLLQRKIDPDCIPVNSFRDPQVSIAMDNCGNLNPMDFEEYAQNGGFTALRKALFEWEPEQILSQIEISGLRGRGGGGFPTHLKWKRVREEKSGEKYVVCNGDEGDPGAFMDRMLLESYPFRIIEGMMIAAKTIGAKKGHLYIRAEYPLAVQRIREAIALCKERGVLGENILSSGFSLDLKVKEGAGAFVCGEETALLESIEGKRGMPRLRPPYPAQKGLWGKPTLINNVETFAMVSWIVQHGGELFRKYGHQQSRGTKVFALAGKIQRGGLIEIPMGITIREVVEKIGGGKRFKAVQIGGPSGGCIPANLSDTPIDFESLTERGAIMGSGGLVVLDETDCMVDIARYFLQFTQEQSCGKCTFCRVGTKRMLEILDRICAGKGKKGDLETLEELAAKIKQGSLCGLGKTAPNPVLSTLKYFRDEYEAHLQGCCPAAKCETLVKYSVNERCNGCTKCRDFCSVGAILSQPYFKHEIDAQRCTKCDCCREICPQNAIERTSPVDPG